jgi:hypothetical protein
MNGVLIQKNKTRREDKEGMTKILMRGIHTDHAG